MSPSQINSQKDSAAVELWRPSEARKQQTQMWQFMQHMAAKHGTPSDDYAALYQHSLSDPNGFWLELIGFYDIKMQGSLQPVNLDAGFDEYGWFPEAQLNFAENLLEHGKDEKTALVSVLENGKQRRLSYGELRTQVAGFQDSIADHVKEGDVLACYMPNVIETAIAMLATTASGGVFTSTSCDFGIEGVIDRFSQAEPRVLVAAEGYFYGGKYFDCLAKIEEIVKQVPSIQQVFIVNIGDGQPDISSIPMAIHWPAAPSTQRTPRYVTRAFADPLYIMYSSGTTGKPKCIVHCVGGTLLKNVQELGLHSDLSADKTIFFFTTCGWMMWNWLIGSLYFGATVVLYDGSPGFPSMPEYLSLIERLQINIFGTSPKFLRALEDSTADISTLNLESLESILCTGSPLLPEQYDYVYNKIKSDVMLASIAGGTDIMGCFFLGNPVLPVYRGELQCAPLGVASACVDENAKSLIDQEGELVCLQSFPSRPIYFLNDRDNERLKAAYFNHFENIWHHGDYIKITPRGGAVFFGRSDSTLNPGGVRIGTSEIYRQTEPFPYLEDAVCVGKQVDGDVDVILFVKMLAGEVLSDDRVGEIKKAIRSNTTPRHVPKQVLQISDIPYTRSGKKIEGVVGNVINGRAVTNVEAIINPECLEEYRQHAD